MEYLQGITLLGSIFMMTGFILIAVEMILPGFSIPGISGTVALIIGIFLNSQTTEQAIFLVGSTVVLLGIMFFLIIKVFSKTRLVKKLVLREELNNDNGYTSSKNLDYLLGKTGVAKTDLRPAGMGDFDGTTFDILSEGSYISKGTPIQIKEVQGSKLIVKQM